MVPCAGAIWDKQIGPAIIVVIRPGATQVIAGIINNRTNGNFRERAIAIVMMKAPSSDAQLARQRDENAISELPECAVTNNLVEHVPHRAGNTAFILTPGHEQIHQNVIIKICPNAAMLLIATGREVFQWNFGE